MKVKKFDNLWAMGLILCGSILLLIYIAKIFFPHFVVEVAQIESITNIGHYIDTHKWAWYLASGLLSYAIYYLICCASCRKASLNAKENLMIAITVVIVYLCREFLPGQYAVVNLCSTVVLPCLMNGDFKATIICFVSTNLLQTITLEIRSLHMLVANFNFATLLILMIDYYIFIWLLYCIFNYKKGEK